MIVKLTDVGSVGWIDDIPAHDLSDTPLAWSSARNFVFRGGLAERASGYAGGFDLTPTAASYGLFSATKTDGTAFLVGCGTDKAFSYTGTTENELTGSTMAATADTKWTGGIFTGFVIANETVNAPAFIAISELAAATNFAALTNWPASTLCKVIRPWKNFLVAGAITESSTLYPYKVRWSTAAVPGTLPASWVATTSNDAGSQDLSADDGMIIDMVPLGDQLAIFRESGIWLMRYIGGSDATNRLVMAFNRVPAGATAGMIGNNCGVELPGIGIAALSNNDAYVFDGQKATSVLDKRLRRWLFDNIDATNRRRSFVLNHATDSEIWFCIPTNGSAACTKAVVWNYKDNTTGVRDLPNATAGIHAQVSETTAISWGSLSALEWSTVASTYASWDAFPAVPISRKTVLSSTDNKLYIIGNGNTANGSTFTAEIQRDYISFGDNQKVKYFRSIWPRFDAVNAQSIEISIGVSMEVGETPDWQTAKVWTHGTSRKIDVNKSGRYLSIRLRSTTGSPWKIRSMDIDLQPQGIW